VADAIEAVAAVRPKPRRFNPTTAVLHALLWPVAASLRLSTIIWFLRHSRRLKAARERGEAAAPAAGVIPDAERARSDVV
jgi:hypothetical protein